MSFTHSVSFSPNLKNLKFLNRGDSPGANVLINKNKIGYIEVLSSNLIDFELNFASLLEPANNKKTYKPLAKYPAIYEDITFEFLGTICDNNNIASLNSCCSSTFIYSCSVILHLLYWFNLL